MKSKSVSAQNLESLVKQVVNEVLEDNEQIIKFRRMIYEEWYFKKWSESKDTNRKENENISETVVHRRSNWYKFEREMSSSSERNIDPSNDENLRTTRSLYENRNKSQGTIVEMTTDVSAAEVDGHDKTVTDENLIEIWHNIPKRPKPKNASNNVSEKVRPRSTDNRSSAKRRNENGLSFEAWTANKTLAYREVLKREQRLRRISVSRAGAERERKHRLFSRQIRARKRPQPIRATEPNLNYPKKEEDAKFDEEETRVQTTRKGARASTPRKGKSASMKIMETFIVDSWLNQLNSILHQRCLGERRHLAQTTGFH